MCQYLENKTLLHLRGDGWPWFLDVKFSRGLSLAVNVLGHDYVKTFILFGHMRNDERVAATLLQDTNVLTFREGMI